MMNEPINILFSSDDNYARHLGAAVYSILDHNASARKISFYVIENGISPSNKEKLSSVVSGFPTGSLQWIPFDGWKDRLSLNMEWSIAISSYARLFVSGMLPADVHRILYLDCDMIAADALDGLWDTDLGDKVIGAVQDYVNVPTKTAVSVGETEPYFNAGLLLIDLDKWRALGIEDACLRFISERQGNVIHHDQGVLNGVLKGKWLPLPIRYNLMTIHFVFNMNKVRKYYDDKASFFPDEEIAAARSAPAILHFTPSFTSRPWVRTCAHPEKEQYWKALRNTPWADSGPEQDKSKWYVRLINWRYRKLPY